MDMWSLGVILFIMLTGCHPYDVSGESTDEEIEERIKSSRYQIPINDPEISGHLSKSAKDLINKLVNRDPKKRLTAYQMLQHPWVRGDTATTAIIKGSDERLSKFRVFKSRLQAKFFENAILLSDLSNDPDANTKRKTSLIERSFNAFDSNNDGQVDAKEILGTDEENIEEIVEGGGPTINITDYENLLSENMENKYYAAGHTIYDEGQRGHAMYFLESGAVEVIANGTRAVRTSGDFFGEGALLHPRKIRSATVRCLTPVHALKISQEYFDKYIASSSSGLYLTLKEKDKIRKRNRAKTILRMQKDMKTAAKPCKSKFYNEGDYGDTMWILEKGKVDVRVADKAVFSVYPGNIFGEHAVITGKQRNCNAVCVSKEGCIAQELQGWQFRKLLASSTSVQDSLKELYLRREFKKAIVYRMRKNFPYEDPEVAFAAADEKHVGRLDKENVSKLMREMNPDFTDGEVEAVIESLDLSGSGSVTFAEMKKALVGDIRTAASM
jgi:CRP-like cAMP-binding protein